ncbi:MAG: AraC family transcriptional regulator [Prolixibacteraceae bacterium]|nr:AraC family transcriptional regulator [Prolixibacteraceae bacterium]
MNKALPIRKKDGFEGQKAIVLSKKVKELCSYTPPINALYITDIGYYPNAQYHFRKRTRGVPQNIFIYCVEGTGYVELPMGTFKIQPNNYLIIPADMAHNYRADTKKPWSIYWIHFRGTQAPYYTSLLSKQSRQPVNYVSYLDERIKVFNELYRTIEDGYTLEGLIFNTVYLGYFLISFCFPERFSTKLHKPQENEVEQAIRFMQQNIKRTLKLEEIASSVYLSTSQFSSKFKSKTGYSPMTYFNQLKIQRACQLLQFTEMRIKEIALEFGIEDPYYFSRLFIKTMGISPTEYRNKANK